MREHKENRTNRTYGAYGLDSSAASQGHDGEGFIPPHGGYENLLSYKKSQIVYDATVKFCDRFVDRKSRTHDQMVQAARSGNGDIIVISLIHQTNYLLDQQIRRLEKDFLSKGGLRERMTKPRLAARARQCR